MIKEDVEILHCETSTAFNFSRTSDHLMSLFDEQLTSSSPDSYTSNSTNSHEIDEEEPQRALNTNQFFSSSFNDDLFKVKQEKCATLESSHMHEEDVDEDVEGDNEDVEGGNEDNGKKKKKIEALFFSPLQNRSLQQTAATGLYGKQNPFFDPFQRTLTRIPQPPTIPLSSTGKATPPIPAYATGLNPFAVGQVAAVKREDDAKRVKRSKREKVEDVPLNPAISVLQQQQQNPAVSALQKHQQNPVLQKQHQQNPALQQHQNPTISALQQSAAKMTVYSMGTPLSSGSQQSVSAPPTPLPNLMVAPVHGEEKDVKKMKRLIKNRESAQASRERKKAYVCNLEKQVSDLNTQTAHFSKRVTSLEDENRELKERLKRLEQRDDRPANASNSKKRKISESTKGLPENSKGLPESSKGLRESSKTFLESNKTFPESTNPLNPSFWKMLFAVQDDDASPVAAAAAAALSSPQQSQYQQIAAATWMQRFASRRVVIFLMLFCVAVLVATNKEGAAEPLSANHVALYNDGNEEMSSSDHSPTNTTSLARKKKKKRQQDNSEEATNKTGSVQQEFAVKLKDIYDKFESIDVHMEESAVLPHLIAQQCLSPKEHESGLYPKEHESGHVKDSVSTAQPLDDFLRTHIRLEKDNLIVAVPVKMAASLEKSGEPRTVQSLTSMLVKEISSFMQV